MKKLSFFLVASLVLVSMFKPALAVGFFSIVILSGLVIAGVLIRPKRGVDDPAKHSARTKRARKFLILF